MWESEKKRQKLKLLWGFNIFRSLWTGLLHTHLGDFFFMIIQVENQYRLRKLKLRFAMIFHKVTNTFLYQMFLDQSNSYQMSSLRNFYQILMFLDHSDLIDVHFKFLEPVIYLYIYKTKQIVWLQVMVKKNIHYLILYVVTKHYRLVITSA